MMQETAAADYFRPFNTASVSVSNSQSISPSQQQPAAAPPHFYSPPGMSPHPSTRYAPVSSVILDTSAAVAAAAAAAAAYSGSYPGLARYPADPFPAQQFYSGAGYGGAFVYPDATAATTHIPINTVDTGSFMESVYRPQPTRSEMKSEPLEAASPNRTTAGYAKDRFNSGGSSSSSGSNLNNNQSSPQHASGLACPSLALSPPASSPASATSASKFRYPSEPHPATTAAPSVQSVPTASPQHAQQQRVGGAVTPSSTLSSREGTPLSSAVKLEDAAPNVDISRVQDKGFREDQQSFQTNVGPLFGSLSPSAADHFAQQQQQHAKTFNQQHNNYPTPQHYPHFGMRPTGPNPGLYTSLYSDPSSMMFGATSAVPTVTVGRGMKMAKRGGGANLGQRPPGHNSGGSTGSTGTSGSSGSGHTHHHVKIGRRPAHLPKVLKFSDKTLPGGWIRKLKQRKHGKQAGRWDVYIYSPCGVKFASRKKLKSFFEKNNLSYDPEDFDFTPYGRHLEARQPGSTGPGPASAASTAATSVVGRHLSSGSTGSEGTHAGSSPSSMSNCSPGNNTAGSSFVSSYMLPVSTAGFSSTTGLGVDGYGLGGTSAFDPFSVEGPPNVNALDVMSFDPMGRSLHHSRDVMGGYPDGSEADLMVGAVGDLSDSADMHNGLLTGYGPTYSDLMRGSGSMGVSSGAGQLQPLSNASVSSRTSDEDLGSAVTRSALDMLGSTVNVLQGGGYDPY